MADIPSNNIFFAKNLLFSTFNILLENQCILLNFTLRRLRFLPPCVFLSLVSLDPTEELPPILRIHWHPDFHSSFRLTLPEFLHILLWTYVQTWMVFKFRYMTNEKQYLRYKCTIYQEMLDQHLLLLGINALDHYYVLGRKVRLSKIQCI